MQTIIHVQPYWIKEFKNNKYKKSKKYKIDKSKKHKIDQSKTKIICEETGVIYDDINKFAEALGQDVKTAKYILKSEEFFGKHYKYTF